MKPLREVFRNIVITWLGEAYRDDIKNNPDYYTSRDVDELVDGLLKALGEIT